MPTDALDFSALTDAQVTMLRIIYQFLRQSVPLDYSELTRRIAQCQAEEALRNP